MLPRFGKFISLLIGERFDIEFLNSFLSLLQKLFSLSGISFGPRHSIVFRPEFRAQLPAEGRLEASKGNGQCRRSKPQGHFLVLC